MSKSKQTVLLMSSVKVCKSGLTAEAKKKKKKKSSDMELNTEKGNTEDGYINEWGV